MSLFGDIFSGNWKQAAHDVEKSAGVIGSAMGGSNKQVAKTMSAAETSAAAEGVATTHAIVTHPLAAAEVAGGAVLSATGLGGPLGASLIAKGSLDIVSSAIKDMTSPEFAPAPAAPPPSPVAQAVAAQTGATPSEQIGEKASGKGLVGEFFDWLESWL